MEVIAPPRDTCAKDAVPRFFFHIHDDAYARDDEGMELPDPEAARNAAIAGLRSLAADGVKDGRLDLRHFIDVEDEAGTRLFRIAVADALHVQGC